MKPTVDSFRATLDRHPRPPRYRIAYSGGLDSHVLLHLCARMHREHPSTPDFIALHVHHGLLPEADAWVSHCARVCLDLGMPFLPLRVDASPLPGQSPEEAARDARYRAIGEHLGAGEILLVAQHRDDQAETLLLQLLRGAGLAGLAAMPAVAPLGEGLLLRPLLQHDRKELQEYAEQHSLHWVEDPSNVDTGYDRNYLRHQIIPRLEARWPGAGKAIGRSAGHCAEALAQLTDLAADLYASALREDGLTLSVARLQSFRAADRRLVLREWLRTRGYRMPAAVVIERILHEALPAAADKTPRVSWREGEVRRYRDGLYLLPPQPEWDATVCLGWDGHSPLELPAANGVLEAIPAAGPGIRRNSWDQGPITVSYRQGGEICRLRGRNGSHPLKKLFQEAGIPPWLRERLPLVHVRGQLAAVADFLICEEFAANTDEEAIALRWHCPRQHPYHNESCWLHNRHAEQRQAAATTEGEPPCAN